MDKKGQMGFSEAPSKILTLGLIALISGAMVITLSALKTGQGVTSVTSIENTSVVNATLNAGIISFGNFTGQLGTIGTMLGISLVLVVILSVFGFGRGKGGGL